MKLIPSCRALQLLLLAPVLSALAVSFPIWSTAEQIPAMTPGELVRRTISNELKSTRESGKYMFRERKETPSGSQTKLLVETRDAMVGMVVAYNDRPLNRDERRGEDTRIQRFIDNPQELDRKHRKEQEDAERIRSI